MSGEPTYERADAALYFLENCGYPLPEQFPITEVVEFCVAIAEENLRQSQDENMTLHSIAEIADWFRRLLRMPEN
ncbi:hypothetical protein L0337_07240 [candidate division KSB1 bacterium]|nr:hypothetical protein [candidate division KSB1 bacterium]